MGSDVNVGLAFFAGILSFISPCVLPLVPAYIGYLTARAAGQSAADLRPAGASAAIKVNRTVVFLHGVFFCLGVHPRLCGLWADPEYGCELDRWQLRPPDGAGWRN